MKLLWGSAQPEIGEAVTLLRQYETTGNDKYNNAIKSNVEDLVTQMFQMMMTKELMILEMNPILTVSLLRIQSMNYWRRC